MSYRLQPRPPGKYLGRLAPARPSPCSTWRHLVITRQRLPAESTSFQYVMERGRARSSHLSQQFAYEVEGIRQLTGRRWLLCVPALVDSLQRFFFLRGFSSLLCARKYFAIKPTTIAKCGMDDVSVLAVWTSANGPDLRRMSNPVFSSRWIKAIQTLGILKSRPRMLCHQHRVFQMLHWTQLHHGFSIAKLAGRIYWIKLTRPELNIPFWTPRSLRFHVFPAKVAYPWSKRSVTNMKSGFKRLGWS